MRKRIILRQLTDQELTEIRSLITTCHGTARMVKRARIIAAMLDDPQLSASKASIKAGYKRLSHGPIWVKRFNENGLDALRDRPRQGRRPVHERSIRRAVVRMVCVAPVKAGYSFKSWTLQRLRSVLAEKYGLRPSISTIWEWMIAAGMEYDRKHGWRAPKSTCGPSRSVERGSRSRISTTNRIPTD